MLKPTALGLAPLSAPRLPRSRGSSSALGPPSPRRRSGCTVMAAPGSPGTSRVLGVGALWGDGSLRRLAALSMSPPSEEHEVLCRHVADRSHVLAP